MLEIPVSTVKVTKKESIFKRKSPAKTEKPVPVPQDDLKELVVESVNERVGAYVYSEDLSEPPKPEKKHRKEKREKAPETPVSRRSGTIIMCELVAICLIATAIFLTNIFMPSSVINTFLSSFSKTAEPAEPTYKELKLSPVVSELSDADVNISDGGVITFTAKTGVYPVCAGTVTSVAGENGLYTVQINHTSTFKSVITGVSSVYYGKNDKVAANIPVAYSDGKNEVKITMYDGDTLLDCYTLSGEVPVWNS